MIVNDINERYSKRIEAMIREATIETLMKQAKFSPIHSYSSIFTEEIKINGVPFCIHIAIYETLPESKAPEQTPSNKEAQ